MNVNNIILKELIAKDQKGRFYPEGLAFHVESEGKFINGVMINNRGDCIKAKNLRDFLQGIVNQLDDFIECHEKDLTATEKSETVQLRFS